MRIFVDTNVLISGIFFSGPESLLLKQADIVFLTSDVNYKEVVEVTKRKFRKLNKNILDYSLQKVEEAFIDIKIVDENIWKQKLETAARYLKGNDQKILAAVLFSQPDYFVTHDRDFYKKDIENIINVVNTKTLLKKLGIIE